MAKDFSRKFYASARWKKCRAGYMKYRFNLCEKCKKQGLIVHHKIKLNAENITDDDIALGWDNLELLCIECHNSEHGNDGVLREDLFFDELGNLKKK